MMKGISICILDKGKLKGNQLYCLCTAGTGVRFFWKSQNSDFWGQTDQKKVCFSWKSQNSRENVVNSAKIPLVMSLQFGDCDDRYFHLNCIYVQSQIFCPKTLIFVRKMSDFTTEIGLKKVWFSTISVWLT